MIARLWWSTDPIDPEENPSIFDDERTMPEADARAAIAAQGYELGGPAWTVNTGLMADEEPTYREREIRREGLLRGWMRVYEEAPPDVAAEVQEALRQWGLRWADELEALAEG